MVKKLFIFTGVTFILFLIGGIVWNQLGIEGFFWYFVIGLTVFAGSNFAYYCYIGQRHSKY